MTESFSSTMFSRSKLAEHYNISTGDCDTGTWYLSVFAKGDNRIFWNTLKSEAWNIIPPKPSSTLSRCSIFMTQWFVWTEFFSKSARSSTYGFRISDFPNLSSTGNFLTRVVHFLFQFLQNQSNKHLCSFFIS